MIPTLVSMIADAHHPDSLSLVELMLSDVRKLGGPIEALTSLAEATVEQVLGRLECLEPLAELRLVPEVPKPSAVSELLSRLCEQCGTRWDAQAQAASQIQSIEWRVLLEYTCRAAQSEI